MLQLSLLFVYGTGECAFLRCVVMSHSRGSHGPQSQEGWGELVAYKPACTGVCLSVLLIVV